MSYCINSESYCCRIAEEARRRLEEEVLTELASHPTVAYIRGLEDECEGYREALAVRAL